MTQQSNDTTCSTEQVNQDTINAINSDVQFDVLDSGGVTSARGFRAAGIHAGFRRDPRRLDCALVVADDICTAAGVFTTNVFAAAPVLYSREILDDCGAGTARAVIVNSGVANAATGQVGLDHARESAHVVAQALHCSSEDVLIASTGVIGVHLPLEPFHASMPSLVERLSASEEAGNDAARAIMTTDTCSKEAAVAFTVPCGDFAGTRVTVGGMVKGSGMIMPNMATMIAVITTDAPLDPGAAKRALKRAADVSFNCVTVDSDTSTNDTCLLLASGKATEETAASGVFEESSEAFACFEKALTEVCISLARQIAQDGEGATRLITVHVQGARDHIDADKAARAIANSPLVKTAIYGHDANWGRIAAAAGKSGAVFDQQGVSIDIMGLPVMRAGLPVEFDEEEALARFENTHIEIEVDLGAGSADATMWTCDFSHEYVKINGEYRS